MEATQTDNFGMEALQIFQDFYIRKMLVLEEEDLQNLLLEEIAQQIQINIFIINTNQDKVV